MSTHTSDAALAVAIGRYDRDALAEAYNRHGSAVFALARRIVRSRELAEEVTQEVFLRLWHKPQRFDPERGKRPVRGGIRLPRRQPAAKLRRDERPQPRKALIPHLL